MLKIEQPYDDFGHLVLEYSASVAVVAGAADDLDDMVGSVSGAGRELATQ